jgi:hypothetical protein
MGLIDVTFMINERSEANCNGKKRDRIDGHEQIDTLVGPETSLDMDGTLNFNCYSLGGALDLNFLRSYRFMVQKINPKGHGVLPKFPSP